MRINNSTCENQFKVTVKNSSNICNFEKKILTKKRKKKVYWIKKKYIINNRLPI